MFTMRLPSPSIAQRITLAFALMILLVLVASGSGLFFNQSVAESINTTSAALEQINSAANLEIAWFQVVASFDNMLLTRQTGLIEGRLGEQLAAFNTQLAALQQQPLGSSPEIIQQNGQLLQALSGLAGELNAMIEELFGLARAGSWTRAQVQRHTELASLQRRFSESLAALQTNIRQGVADSIAASVELQSVTQRGWVGVSFLAVVAGTLAGFLTARSIIRPVYSLVETAQAIQKGDLSKRAEVSGANELSVMANSFNRMTAQLGQSIANLEQNVAELERSNRERDRLIKELEEALLFKDQFLATMSHELRTPLNAVLGYAALILDEEGIGEDVSYMVSRIEGNSTRLLNLINDVLDISRINANRVEILSRPIELSRMVRSWHHDFSHQAEEKGLGFEVEIDPALPETILGDEERLTQIAGNLLQNAFKFTSKGQVTLRAKREGEDRWSFTVSDTGQGIPETWHHLIFDEFRQVDSGSKRKYGGAGLGLSIVKKLCLLMGGSVTVSSKIDVGSTFTVTLPLQAEAVLEPVFGAAASAREEFENVADAATP
jgi:signal transduction histidine kinase